MNLLTELQFRVARKILDGNLAGSTFHTEVSLILPANGGEESWLRSSGHVLLFGHGNGPCTSLKGRAGPGWQTLEERFPA